MKTINQLSGMPQIGPAFFGWQIKITVVRITQAIVDGFSIDTEEQIYFQGTVQPLNPKAIVLKPEGQRDWGWLQIHCFTSNFNLLPNDRILYNDQKYKVMATLDYKLNNYIEYHAVEDYRPG